MSWNSEERNRCRGGGGGESFLRGRLVVLTASRSSAGLWAFNRGCRSWQPSGNLSTSEKFGDLKMEHSTDGQGQP